MSVKRRTFIFIVLALLLWGLVASLVSAYYYSSYNDLFQKTRKPIVHVTLGLNYGNGTIQWFNQTEARSGDTLLDVSKNLAEVNYTSYTTGAYVNSINNVENTASNAWTWWTWTSQFGWNAGPIASDKYILGDGEIAYWYFGPSTYPPTPPS